MKKIFFLLLIFISGCFTSDHYLIYEAEPSSNIYTFYSNGKPITSYKNGNSFILLAAEETYLLKKSYIRVWLLYKNDSKSPILLEPYNIISLTGKYKKKEFTFYAQSPTDILDAIDEQKNISLIVQSIGGALKAISTDGTTVTGNNGTKYKVNDQAAKRDQIIEQTQNNISNTSNWYNIFETSFNNGVLRKNTIFPDNSVNGYIYFPLPDVTGSENWGYNSNYTIDELKFTINLKINDKTKIIELKPVKVW